MFVDSEKDTWNMDPIALEKAFEIYPDVKLIVLAHLYGTPAKMEEIRKMEEGLGYGQMLDLIPEPKSRIIDGERVTEGMSYSDAEILMECYNSVIWFTQDALKETGSN